MHPLPSKSPYPPILPTFSITSPSQNPLFTSQARLPKSSSCQARPSQGRMDFSNKIIKERRQSRETPKFPHKKSTVRKSLSLLAKKAYRVHRKALPPIITKEGLKNYKSHLYNLDQDFEDFLKNGHISFLKNINKSFEPYKNTKSLMCDQVYLKNCDKKMKQNFIKVTKISEKKDSDIQDRLQTVSRNSLSLNSQIINPIKEVKLIRTLSTFKNLKNHDIEDFPNIFKQATTRSAICSSKPTLKTNRDLIKDLKRWEAYQGGNKPRVTNHKKTHSNVNNAGSDNIQKRKDGTLYLKSINFARSFTPSQA
ncbi:unnamed protein product [Moneuplotes crassus]|uniref:Uncharacterized protein n=1 Tax=Euplotes crassus TaxID=5936 RepID=A0AAD1U3C9_EUPCR|nr:unnamed protein product [Moneuplotes crassus]